jgi:DNA-binding HxlR family transcriptional regulator
VPFLQRLERLLRQVGRVDQNVDRRTMPGTSCQSSRAALPVTPRALALALRELEVAGLVEREVLATRPPSTRYRVTRAGGRIVRAL